jgi:hypothetical protein
MTENMNLNEFDTINPSDEIQSKLEIPEGLDLSKVEEELKKYNKEWERVFNIKKEDWKEYYSLFRKFEKESKQKVASKVNEVWSLVQTEVPHLVNSIFSKSEIIKPVPRFQDNNNNTLKIKNYINRVMTVNNKGRKKTTDAIQNALVFGTAVAKSFWNNDPDYFYNLETQAWEAKIEGRPDWYNLDIFDFAIDPNYLGHDIQEALWCRERLYFTKEEIIKMRTNGEVEDFSDEEVRTKAENEGAKMRQEIEGGNSHNDKNKVFVDEFWVTLYWKNEEGIQVSDQFYIWLLNNKKIIKFKVNPFKRKPYVVARTYRISNEFWGIGECEILKAEAEQLSGINTQLGLLSKKTGQKFTMIDDTAGISVAELKRKEDGVIHVQSLNGIKVENTTSGNDMQVLGNHKQSVQQDMQNSIGVDSVLKGEDQGDRTASAVSIQQSNSSARLSIKLQNIQDEYIAELAKHMFLLSQQFVEEFSFIVENQIINLTQADFSGMYDFVPTGSVQQANKEVRKQQMMQLAQGTIQAVQVAAQSYGLIHFPAFNLGKFYQNEILPLFDIQDPQQYFNEEIQQQSIPQPGIPQDQSGLVPATPDVNQQGMTAPTLSDIEQSANTVQ